LGDENRVPSHVYFYAIVKAGRHSVRILLYGCKSSSLYFDFGCNYYDSQCIL